MSVHFGYARWFIMTGAVQQAQRPMLSRISCCRQRWCWLVLVLWSNNLRRIQPTFGVTLRRVTADPNHTKAVTSSAIITIQIRFGRGLFWIPHTTHTLQTTTTHTLGHTHTLQSDGWRLVSACCAHACVVRLLLLSRPPARSL